MEQVFTLDREVREVVCGAEELPSGLGVAEVVQLSTLVLMMGALIGAVMMVVVVVVVAAVVVAASGELILRSGFCPSKTIIGE